jgi:hypothetical protein
MMRETHYFLYVTLNTTVTLRPKLSHMADVLDLLTSLSSLIAHKTEA